MIHQELKIAILGKGEDQEGRITFLKCIHNGNKITFINVYAPNSHDSTLVESPNSILFELTEFHPVIET